MTKKGFFALKEIKNFLNSRAPKELKASPAQGVANANPSRFLRGEHGKPWVKP